MSIIICFGNIAFASSDLSSHNSEQSEDLHLNNLGFGSTRRLPLFSSLAAWQCARPSIKTTAAMSLFISPCLVTYKSSHCPFTSRLQRQEVLEELFAGIGEDGFGVELDAFDFVATMAETHDDAVVSLGRDGELARQGFFLDDEGMVARRGERVGQLAENVLMVVMNLAGFSLK